MFRLFLSSGESVLGSLWSALTSAMTALIGFFTDIFSMVTSSAVLPWIVLGVAVPLFGIMISFFKRVVWGSN